MAGSRPSPRAKRRTIDGVPRTGVASTGWRGRPKRPLHAHATHPPGGSARPALDAVDRRTPRRAACRRHAGGTPRALLDLRDPGHRRKCGRVLDLQSASAFCRRAPPFAPAPVAPTSGCSGTTTWKSGGPLELTSDHHYRRNLQLPGQRDWNFCGTRRHRSSPSVCPAC